MKGMVFYFNGVNIIDQPMQEVTKKELKSLYVSSFEKLNRNGFEEWNKRYKEFDGQFFVKKAHKGSDFSLIVELDNEAHSLKLWVCSPDFAKRIYAVLKEAIEESQRDKDTK
jgi:hypothetical protein